MTLKDKAKADDRHVLICHNCIRLEVLSARIRTCPFPKIKDRARPRIRSVVMGGTVPASRKKSYPMMSDVPATMLPTKQISDGLIEVFHQRGMVFFSFFLGYPF